MNGHFQKIPMLLGKQQGCVLWFCCPFQPNLFLIVDVDSMEEKLGYLPKLKSRAG